MPLSDSISFPDSIYQLRPITRSGPGAYSNGLESQPESYSFDRAGTADRERSSSDGNPLTHHPSSGPSKDSNPPAFQRDDRFPRGNSKDDGDGEEGIGLHM